jgi:hypothetical protein
MSQMTSLTLSQHRHQHHYHHPLQDIMVYLIGKLDKKTIHFDIWSI